MFSSVEPYSHKISSCISSARAEPFRQSLYALVYPQNSRVEVHNLCGTQSRVKHEKRFRGGPMCKAHRWLHHSTLGTTVIKRRRSRSTQGLGIATCAVLRAASQLSVDGHQPPDVGFAQVSCAVGSRFRAKGNNLNRIGDFPRKTSQSKEMIWP